MYTNKKPYAFLFLPASSSKLNVYEVSWNTKNHTGSINVLYTTISLTSKDCSPTITDFTVVGDRLFIVLSELNQIWVYSIGNNNANKLYIIA